MRLFFLFFLACLPLKIKAESAFNSDRAIHVKFFGGITGFDQSAYKVLKSVVASYIAEGIIDHYITTSVGLEGGSSFCIELSVNPTLRLEPILASLSSIRPSGYSIYEFQTQLGCTSQN